MWRSVSSEVYKGSKSLFTEKCTSEKCTADSGMCTSDSGMCTADSGMCTADSGMFMRST